MNEVANAEDTQVDCDTPIPGQAELEILLKDTQRSLRELTISARIMALGPERMLPVFFRDHVIRVHVPFADFDEGQRRLVVTSKLEDDLSFLQLAEFGILRPGATLVVGGGYLGVSTVALARIMEAGDIHVFEPQACLAEPLRVTLDANGLNRAKLHGEVLAEAGSAVALGTQKPSRLDDTVYVARRDGKVPAVALDKLKLKNVGLIHYCFRGTKIAALRGSEKTIRAQSPVIICDKLGRDLPEIEAWLGGMGYRAQIIGARLCLFVREES